MTAPPLYFIHPRILKRLRSGQFIPSRKSKPAPLHLNPTEPAQPTDRRHALSPLAITKRCVPYQPNVFYHRRDALLNLADHLNNPDTRMLLIDGHPGTGKTSLARGLVEMMGSNDEQVLWFDINPHSTVDDMVRFFIEYLEQLSHFHHQHTDANLVQKTTSSSERLRTLKKQFQAIDHIPILIVLDHLEHQVDPDTLELRSNTLRELLNFLLGFRNLTLCLMGQQLPLKDVAAQPPVIIQHTVRALPPTIWEPWLIETGKINAEQLSNTTGDWQQGLGNPWRLNTWLHYRQHKSLSKHDLLQADWLQTALEQLPVTEQLITQLFYILRHPINLDELAWLVDHSQRSSLTLSATSSKTTSSATVLKEHLKTSLIRPWLKRFVPPQTILLALYKGKSPETKPAHQLQMYVNPLAYFEQSVDEDDLKQLHQRLSELYLSQKEAKNEQRVLTLSNAQLIHEARYHQEQAHQLTAGEHQPKHDAHHDLDEDTDPIDLSIHPDNMDADDDELTIHETTLATSKQHHHGADHHHPEGDWDKLTTGTSSQGQPMGPDKKPEPDKGSEIGPAIHHHHHTTVVMQQPVPPHSTVTSPRPNNTTDTIDPLPSGPEIHNEENSPSTQHSSTPTQQQPITPIASLNAERDELRHALEAKDTPRIINALFSLAQAALLDGDEHTTTIVLSKLHKYDLSSLQRARYYLMQGHLDKNRYQYRNALTALDHCERILREEAPNLNEASTETTLETSIETTLETTLRISLNEHRGDIYTLWESPDKAADSYQQAIKWLDKEKETPNPTPMSPLMSPSRQAELYFKSAQAYEAIHQQEQAWSAYHYSIQYNKIAAEQATLDTEKPYYALASANSNLASLCLEHHRPKQAIDYFTEALHYDTVQGNRAGQYETHHQLAKAHLLLQQFEPAIEHYQHALQLAQNERHPRWEAHVYIQLGHCAKQQGQKAKAIQYYQLAKQASPTSLVEGDRHQYLNQLIEDLHPHDERHV